MGITGGMTSHLSSMSTQSASIFPPLTPCHFSLSTTPPRNIPSPPLRLSHRGSLVLRATNDKASLNPIPFHKRTFKFKSLMGQLTRPCFLEPAGFSLVGGLKSSTLGLQRTLDETSSTFLRQVKTFIQMRTILKVADNSGAKLIMCIQPLKPKKGGARLGDTIVASVKESQPGVNVKKGVKVKTGVKDFQPGGKVKKGDVVYAVVVRAAMPKGRCDGSEVKFDDNAAVLINKKGEPIGTRVFGPVPHELRLKKHVKILSLAEHIV